MPGEPDFDPKTVWTSQPTEYVPMSLAEIHQKARLFERRVRRRNVVEYIAGAIVVASFAPVLLRQDSWLMQAGAALLMAAAGWGAWQLHRRAAARAVPERGETLIAFHRAELVRQRDALRNSGVWYIAPFVPGMVLLLLGRWLQAPARHRSVEADHLVILAVGGFTALMLLAVWWLNQWAARRLQQQIDQLPPEAGDPAAKPRLGR